MYSQLAAVLFCSLTCQQRALFAVHHGKWYWFWYCEMEKFGCSSALHASAAGRSGEVGLREFVFQQGLIEENGEEIIIRQNVCQ